MRLFHDGVDVIMPHTFYLQGNLLDGNEVVNRNNWAGTGYDQATYQAEQPFPAPSVATEPAAAAYGSVLKSAGAILPRRDARGRAGRQRDQNGDWPYH